MRISQWKTKLAVTAAYLGIVALFYFGGLSCIFQQFFGIICPGCGMTRALLAALRLDFGTAFSYHPMFWSLPILYLYFLSDKGLFPGKLWDRLLLTGIFGGFLVNWLVKLWGNL
jgi:hypothetical protein